MTTSTISLVDLSGATADDPPRTEVEVSINEVTRNLGARRRRDLHGPARSNA